ncbi:MAG: 3'-5' exonuclease [Victivallales bacterium]
MGKDCNMNPSKWHELGPFTVFDVETTGMSPVCDRIVEIAAIRVDIDGFHSRFHSLLNPGIRIPDEVIRIHRISNTMVEKSPSFSSVGKEFMSFAEDSTLVAHNGRFDLSFLQESLSRHGIALWKGKTMDSIAIIKHAYPGLPSYSLQNLQRHFSLGTGDGQAHRAFTDVEWTLEIFGMSMQRLLDANNR